MGRRGRPRGETLTRDQVVDAAIAIADAEGLEGLSMRKLGKAVGVQAMSLYNHVANREALLDALVERIVLEITPPGALLDELDGLFESSGSGVPA